MKGMVKKTPGQKMGSIQKASLVKYRQVVDLMSQGMSKNKAVRLIGIGKSTFNNIRDRG